MTTPAPPTPVGDPAPPASDRWQVAARDAWSVVWRCVAILLGIAVVGVVAAVATSQSGAGGAAYLLGLMWVAHALITLVVGYPVGVVTTRLLPAAPGAPAAVGAFALAGAVAGWAVVATLAHTAAADFSFAVWSALGGVTAGSARAWAQRSVVRRRERRGA